MLSNIFLAKVDRSLERNLSGLSTKVFRYVDDFLVFTEPCHLVRRVPDVMKIFKECGLGLNFTFELPKENQIQFLDLKLSLESRHVCWEYSPRSMKPVLNFNSGHSKIVKTGIAVSSLRCVFAKSCIHRYSKSFSEQITRLTSAGYSTQALRLAVGKIQKWVKSGSAPRERREAETNKKFSVMPYIHVLSHSLKNVAGRYGVNVLFSAPNKLGKICSAVDKKLANTATRARCDVKHVSNFVPCCVGVVYLIPFSCGHVYIGQTGRCLNIRLMEHRRSLKGKEYSHIAQHCSKCSGCFPVFKDTKVVAKHNNQHVREIIEAFHIRRNEGKCVSAPSLTLLDKEFHFLSASRD